MEVLKDNSDRRASRRRSLDEIPDVTAVKVQSEEVAVVNASRGGILIECGLRLPPGTASQLEILKMDGPLRVRGRVVRCEVTRVSSERLYYRIAFAFSDNLDFISDEEFTGTARFEEPTNSPTFTIQPPAVAGRADEVVELESFAANSW
jgi:hypothetical protein